MATGADLVNVALTQLGDDYDFGAEGPDAYDCSGLIWWAAKQLGITIPRVTYDQVRQLPAVNRENLQVGDLIFTHWGKNPPSSHVGIYMGDDTILHASSSADQVTTRKMDEAYWTHVDGIRRIPGIAGGGATANPNWWDIPGVVLQAGRQSAGGVIGTVRSGLDGIGDALTAVGAGAMQVGNVANAVMKLFYPNNFIRAVCGFAGTIFILIGIYFLSREVRQSSA